MVSRENLALDNQYIIQIGTVPRLAQYIGDRTWTIGSEITARFHMFRDRLKPLEIYTVHTDRLCDWVQVQDDSLALDSNVAKGQVSNGNSKN